MESPINWRCECSRIRRERARLRAASAASLAPENRVADHNPASIGQLQRLMAERYRR
jgi:hypothetical protein